MTAERWRRLRALFDAALDLEDGQRAAFVAESCGGDSDLQSALESLIEHVRETGPSFDRALNGAVDLQGSIPTGIDLVGRTLGRFRIVERIGGGGMGEVFRAADTRLGREVAIKVLTEGFTRDTERLARFEREARVLASLDHPAIATIHGIEETDDSRYLVLELVRGKTLRSELAEGPLPLRTVIRVAAQIAEGLATAHEAGTVHRDLKPDNLMLAENGSVKILDFGLAKAAADLEKPVRGEPDVRTATGRIMGTSSYLSPEQARGQEVDYRSDQFSFGSVLFEMVTGARAFARPTDAETLVAIMRSEPDRTELFQQRVPGPLRSIIERCLAKEPEGRYKSTRDLARALRSLQRAVPENSEAEIAVSVQPRTRKRGLRVVGAALFGAATLTTAVMWWQSSLRTGEVAVPDSGATASVAVLPFENLGPRENEYFADGMTAALITQLSKIEELKVISRTSVMRFKGSRQPLPEIADVLGVETVLSGSVLHSRSRVRISAQLTEAATDRNLWAEDYDYDVGDILALQSAVARAVAGAVEVEIDPGVEARMITSRRIDPEAHEAYFRGLAEVDLAILGRPTFRESLQASFGHFQRAVELEPEWADPYAKLAIAYCWLAGVGASDEQAEYYPKAKAAALKALELDDTVADAHSALGRVLVHHEWDWAAAERAHQRAIEFDPSLASWGYARYLWLAGRYDEAIDRYTMTRERYPTSSLVRYHGGRTLSCAGRHDEAEAEARRLMVDDPDSRLGIKLLGMTYLDASRYQEAAAMLEQVEDLLSVNAWEVGWLPYAQARAGDLAGARETLDELQASGCDCWYPHLFLALGQEEQAMAQIEAAFAVRRDVLLIIRCNPEFERLMEIPRFREIIDAIGFPN